MWIRYRVNGVFVRVFGKAFKTPYLFQMDFLEIETRFQVSEMAISGVKLENLDDKDIKRMLFAFTFSCLIND